MWVSAITAIKQLKPYPPAGDLGRPAGRGCGQRSESFTAAAPPARLDLRVPSSLRSVNPTGFGKRDTSVALYDGARRVATISRSTEVFPRWTS